MCRKAMLLLVCAILAGCASQEKGISKVQPGSGDSSATNTKESGLKVEFFTEAGRVATRPSANPLWKLMSIDSPPLTLRIHEEIGELPVRICAASEYYALSETFKQPVGKPCFRKSHFLSPVDHDEAIDGNILRMATDAHNLYTVSDRQHEPGLVTLELKRITARYGRSSIRGMVYMVIWVDLNGDDRLGRNEVDFIAIRVLHWPKDERIG